jgi:hypothetical protein
MADGVPGAKARKLLLRLPRSVRVVLAFWTLGLLLAPLLFGLVWMVLLPIGAPRSINVGPAWEFLNRNYLPTSFVAGIPLFIFVVAEEWPGKMERLAKYAPPLAKVSMLLTTVWLWSGISVALIRDVTAPLVANAILRPPVEEWTTVVNRTKLGRRNHRECPNRLSFDIPTVSDTELSVCARRNTTLFEAKAGNTLHLKGRYGPFGITYDPKDVRLEKLAQPTN